MVHENDSDGTMRLRVRSLALLSGLKGPAWLWWRPAAVAQNRPLAWELPYAASVAIKSK